MGVGAKGRRPNRSRTIGARGETGGGRSCKKGVKDLFDENISAVFWRKVILVLKVILRYGRLKLFFSLDQKKAPRKACGLKI